MSRTAFASRQRDHLIVCGEDALAYRLVEELSERNEQVTVLLPSRKRHHGPQIGRIPKVHLIETDRLDDDAFRSARVENARAIAFVHQDDVANVHAALRVRARTETVPIVLRLFNTALAGRIRKLIGNCEVISGSEIAAPSFVATALGEIADAHVELGDGQTIYLTRIGAVPRDKLICGIIDGPDAKRLVPGTHPDVEIVLALADAPHGRSAAARLRLRQRMRRAMSSVWDLLRETLDKKLRIATVILLAFVIAGTFLVAENHVPRIGWLQAAYVIMLATAGAVNPDLKASGVEQVTQMIVSFAGIALVPVFTASIVETVVGRRIAAATGQLRKPISDHVIVIGLGNVGTQVITQLHGLGVPVVAIEMNETATGVETARRLGIPVVHGNASRAETLQSAQVRTCRSLVAVTSSDVANLEAAWNARDIRPNLRVVLRVGDGDLARRINERSDVEATLSVSTVAAPAFAAAMTDQEIKGTLTVGRTVLPIAEVTVDAGSELDGATINDIRTNPVRTGAWTLAVTDDDGTEFTPKSARTIRAGDRLLIFAGRADLRRTMRRAESPAREEPAA